MNSTTYDILQKKEVAMHENLVTIRPKDAYQLFALLDNAGPYDGLSLERGADEKGEYTDYSFPGMVPDDTRRQIESFAIHTYWSE